MTNRRTPKRPKPTRTPKFYAADQFSDWDEDEYEEYEPPRRRRAPAPESQNLISQIFVNHASFFIAALFGAIGFGINFYYEAQAAHSQVVTMQKEIEDYKIKVQQLEAKAQLEQMMRNAPLPQTPPGR